MRRAAGLAAAILIASVLAAAGGCGGSEDSEPQSPTPAEAQQGEREARELRQLEAEIRREQQAEKKKAKAKPAPEPKPDPEPKPGGAPAKFSGAQADRYETDYFICNSAGTSKVAKEFGVPGADEVAAAEAYADGYRADFHQAAFEGCLDGLLG